MKTVIHWFRRDLRITDNTALSVASARAERVVPVFVLEDAFRTGPDVGAARLGFLLESLKCLQMNLAALGFPLILRFGRSDDVLPALCLELKAEAVFCNRRYEPYASARDERIGRSLGEIGVAFEVFKDAVVWEGRDLLTGSGAAYTVFTPYAKKWRTESVPQPRPALSGKAAAPTSIPTESIPAGPEQLGGHALRHSIPKAGERAGQECLRHFLAESVGSYSNVRDFPALDGTSHLSAHLRCGTIGIRTVLAKLSAARRSATSQAERTGCDVFLNELIWREFFLQILANFPRVMKESFRPQYTRLEWSNEESHFQAWCEGQTGYPIVDAAMRCLNATGWMHNRLRMITAMFLTKDLLINWQRGERYFMHRLVDGDMAANNGGWQWSAGTGTDAAPYFRIFNPVSQGERFDPGGAFVRQWVPELAGLPDDTVHQPWRDAVWAARASYPKPIVDHTVQREKCLRMYQAVGTKPTQISK